MMTLRRGCAQHSATDDRITTAVKIFVFSVASFGQFEKGPDRSRALAAKFKGRTGDARLPEK